MELDQKEDPVLAMAAWTMAFTALRWGGVSALEWNELDVEKRIMVLRKAQKGRLLPTAKTRRARYAGVSPLLLELLVDYRDELYASEHHGLESG